MSSLLSQVENQLERIKQLTPPGVPVQDYLRDLLDTQIAALARPTSLGIVPVYRASPAQALASARVAVEMLEDQAKLVTRPEGIVDLGTIEWQLRPALPLRDNRIEPPAAGEWKNLTVDCVAASARGVCRIDLGIKDYGFFQIGTGFVVGAKDENLVIMTNAHVVEYALRQGWPNSPAVTFACDFARFAVDTGGAYYLLADQFCIHSRYDLALLYLPLVHFGADNRPPVLPVATGAPNLAQLRMGVVGHPSFNAQFDAFPRHYGFGNEFGVKRLSPGYIRALQRREWRQAQVDVALHDAATLSGSSGSCILDLNTMKVIGLHFGGWPMAERRVQVGGENYLATLFSANGAVPLWTLRSDPLLKDVVFG